MTDGQNVQHAILESSKVPCFLGSVSRAVYEAEDDQILKGSSSSRVVLGYLLGG